MKIPARCCAVLATIGILTLAGCGSRASGNTINIGISGPASGAFAAQRSINDGAEAYFRMLNARNGGINGRRIEVSRADDQYDPSKSPAAVRQLVLRDQAQMMCSAVGSPENLAVKPYLGVQKVPNIAPATGATALFTPTSSTQFGVVPPYERETANLVRFAVQKLHAQRIAVAYEDDDVGGPAVDGVKYEVNRLGKKLVAALPISRTSTDLTAEASKLQAAKPDFTIVWAVAVPLSLLVKNAHQIGFDPVIGGPFFAADSSTVALTNGLISGRSYWENWIVATTDPPAALARTATRRYFPSDAFDSNVLQGWSLATVCAQVVKKATANGRPPTKDNIRAAADSLRVDNPYVHGLSWSHGSHLGNSEERVYKLVGSTFKPWTKPTVLPPVPLTKP
ncbi:MAG TPA: ABC transporter substrate-binding protein [Streptosporangiaceae bacterium]